MQTRWMDGVSGRPDIGEGGEDECVSRRLAWVGGLVDRGGK